jgi:hypothetical protein
VSVQYRVYVTPLYSAFVYGVETEITDYVENVSGEITKSIDSTDYSVGVYTFNDVSLTCENSSGKLSDQNDSRSLFYYTRDKAKIRIVADDGSGSPPTTYHGLINDEATTVQSDTDEIVFTVLGPDSVLKNSIIPAGSVTNGMTVTQALVAILNTSDVRSVLGVTLTNLNPQNNVVIDDGTKFDNLNKRDAIALLLAVSNSVLFIDASLNVIVRDRSPNFQNPTIYLYGKGDPFGRENIKSISNYNTGLQRTFNSILVKGGQAAVTVNDTLGNPQSVAKTTQVGSAQSLTSQALYGIRQKQLDFAFITTKATLDSIAAGYTGEFAFNKLELQVTVPTPDVASAELLDQVSVSYPLLVTPAGKFLPVIGVTKIGDTDSPLPYVKGAIAVDAGVGFKIIEKTEDITTFETTLKLRQIGINQNDGGLTVPTSTRTVTQTSDGQITTADDIILIDCSSGNVDVTMPSPASNPQKPYTVIRIDATTNRGRVLPYASERVAFGSSVTLASKGDGVQFCTNRTDWFSFALSRQPIYTLPATSFTLVNNQSSAANVTGLLFDKTLYRTAVAIVDVRRKTDTASSEVRASHRLVLLYSAQADSWTLFDEQNGDADGLTFSVTSAGQVQYTSTNITGTNGVHNLYFCAEMFNV